MASAKANSAQTATLSATAIWLVGHPLSSIEELNQLPKSGMALCQIYYEMKSKKALLPIACSTIADEVM